MQILLLGETGYLGSYLAKNLLVDTLESRKIYKNGKKYDYVINCISRFPSIQYCEEHLEETDYSNRDVILDIQEYYPTAKIINFSSYYVYDCEGECTEDSTTTDKYNYTRQKLQGEKLIQNGVTFRLGKLFGNPDLTKQYRLTEYIILQDNLVLDNVLFNPLSLTQVLKVIKYELETKSLQGVYNLANKGACTHYEYGVFIAEALNTSKTVLQSLAPFHTFSNYGKFTMSCNKLEQHIPLAHWEQDMVDYLNFIS